MSRRVDDSLQEVSMSDEPQAGGEQPTAGTRTGAMILLRIAIMFGIVPMAIMFAANYFF
jgi:hypothetical protein